MICNRNILLTFILGDFLVVLLKAKALRKRRKRRTLSELSFSDFFARWGISSPWGAAGDGRKRWGLWVSGCLPLGWLQHSAGAYQCRGCSVPRKAGSKRWLGFLRTLEKGTQLTVLTSLSSLYVFCCRTLRKREIISGENIIFMFRYVEILFLL